MATTEQFLQAAQLINHADAIIICAGAGMGVDSGLPDFRGDEGFWKAYPPMAKLGISFVDMANPFWFENRPRLAWGFYGHRLNLYRETVPHSGFDILLKWGKTKPGGYFVFTSNVDGQFQKAGFDENHIEEVHGSIHHFQCTIPCSRDIWEASTQIVKINEETFEAEGNLPMCPHCNKLARPNILMFGDWNWIFSRSNMQTERFDDWLSNAKKRDLQLVIIEMGAGSAVATVRATSEKLSRLKNATLIRINPREPQVPSGNIGIAAGSAEALEQIDKLINLMN